MSMNICLHAYLEDAMVKTPHTLLGLALCLAVTGIGNAQVIASSTFDIDDEGWIVGEFYALTGSVTPTYVPTGGNPGGFIRTTDMLVWSAFHAPAKFLGNMSAAYGGNLHV